MTPPGRPRPRLARAAAPHLADGAEVEAAFVAQVGRNPAWILGWLPVFLAYVVLSTVGGVAAAIGLVGALAYSAWLWAVLVPMQHRVVVAGGDDLVVLDATKLRFNPKGLVRRLDRDGHDLGPLAEPGIAGLVDLGDGERAWVYRGYRGTIDAIDGRR